MEESILILLEKTNEEWWATFGYTPEEVPQGKVKLKDLGEDQANPGITFEQEVERLASILEEKIDKDY